VLHGVSQSVSQSVSQGIICTRTHIELRHRQVSLILHSTWWW